MYCSSRIRTVIACWLLLAAISVGCGRDPNAELHSVTGQVLIDGVGESSVTVMFHPVESGKNSLRGYGRTDAQGMYTIRPNGAAHGLPLGRYRVSLSKRLGTGVSAKSGEARRKEMMEQFKKIGQEPEFEFIVPQKYMNPDQSELMREVKASEDPNDNHFVFKIEKAIEAEEETEPEEVTEPAKLSAPESKPVPHETAKEES